MSDVKACPECDSAKIQIVNRSPWASTGTTHDNRYRCNDPDCDATFDEPNVREPKGHQNTVNGLAGRLHRADSLADLREGGA